MTLSDPQHVVILGAGHAGGAAAATLRQLGHGGAITLIGEETTPPYQRPPLSKTYLKGEIDLERLLLKPTSFYSSRHIELKLGTAATGIDCAERQVRLADGTLLDYDRLIIATGATPRRLTVPGADLDGVQVLRTLADGEALKPRFRPDARLVVIGAGYIGLEASAVARQMGLQVSIMEAAPRVLARVAGEPLSTLYTQEHRAQGVRIHLDAQVVRLHGEAGRVTGVELAGGEIVAADIVLVGIGVTPNSQLAETAGIQCNNGILVDEDARTSDPAVFAIGDCSLRPLAQYARKGRLESVHNALEQARLAASAILGRPRPPLELPWFWSDQYALKLQTAGLLEGHDKCVLRGDPASRNFACYYLRNGQLLAVDAVNSPADFIFGRKIAGRGLSPDIDVLGAATTDLRQLAEQLLEASQA